MEVVDPSTGTEVTSQTLTFSDNLLMFLLLVFLNRLPQHSGVLYLVLMSDGLVLPWKIYSTQSQKSGASHRVVARHVSQTPGTSRKNLLYVTLCFVVSFVYGMSCMS